MEYIGHNFVFAAVHIAELNHMGIHNIGSFWSLEQQRFWTWKELYFRYEIPATKKRQILAMIATSPYEWIHILQHQRFLTQPGKYVGI